MNKKHLMPVAIILLIILIGIAAAKPRIEANLLDLKNLTFADINLSETKDGTYKGSHKAFPITAEVTVTVKNHMIAEIEITKHDNGKGKAAEAIINNVIESQSLQVDAISGATYSSKVILKAIENALIKKEL